MKLKVEASGVPEGFYKAKFTGLEEGTHEEYGPRFNWRFTIVGGKHDGTETGRFTGAKPKPSTECLKMLCGIAGRQLELDDEFDPDSMIGTLYDISVELTQNGKGTRVAKAVLVKNETAPAGSSEQVPY